MTPGDATTLEQTFDAKARITSSRRRGDRRDRNRSDPNPWKGLVGGLAGGIAGTWMMTQFQNLRSAAASGKTGANQTHPRSPPGTRTAVEVPGTPMGRRRRGRPRTRVVRVPAVGVTGQAPVWSGVTPRVRCRHGSDQAACARSAPIVRVRVKVPVVRDAGGPLPPSCAPLTVRSRSPAYGSSLFPAPAASEGAVLALPHGACHRFLRLSSIPPCHVVPSRQVAWLQIVPSTSCPVIRGLNAKLPERPVWKHPRF